MMIGEVARQLNIPASTIRYYEKKGLISPDRKSGKRIFSDTVIVRLQFIQLCQAAGFTISEIRGLLTDYTEDSNGSGPWLPMVEVKLAAVQNQISKLQRTEALLGELVNCRCQSIDQCVRVALAKPVTGDELRGKPDA